MFLSPQFMLLTYMYEQQLIYMLQATVDDITIPVPLFYFSWTIHLKLSITNAYHNPLINHYVHY